MRPGKLCLCAACPQLSFYDVRSPAGVSLYVLSIALEAAARNVPERNRQWGERRSTQSSQRAQRVRSFGCDFRDIRGRACMGMCDGFAADLHDSRVTCAQLGPPGILGLPNYG